MTRDRQGFFEFLQESETIIRVVQNQQYDDFDHLKRLIHTLKGNSAIFGMQAVSEACHQLENLIAEQGETPTNEELAGLVHAWNLIRADIARLTGAGEGSNIEIDSSEYRVILNALRSSVGLDTLARMVESWRLEPTGKRLVRVEQQIKGLAERMGKSHVKVSIDPGDLRFNSDHYAQFWSAFIHVLRNAVDHGADSPEERQRQGKPAEVLIKISTKIEGDNFVVSVEDDGPGVDWDALRAKAERLGIPVQSNEKLLFLDGLSTRDAVSDFSGRGMGLGAVAESCRSIGGSIEVCSKRGAGTRIRFVFPKNQDVYEGHSALLRHVGLTA